MAKPDFLILCSGAHMLATAVRRSAKTVELDTHGTEEQVNLKIDDISRRFARNIPSELVDLLEIASYVYCGDQATSRGGDRWQNNGERWNRNLKFIIPVRNFSFWNRSEIKEQLKMTLGFLSGDNYEFQFRKQRKSRPVQDYINFTDREFERQFEEVMLFSGGLDSLGGAVQEAVIDRRKVALVSHRSSPTIKKRQIDLLKQLRGHCLPGLEPYHIPVMVNKSESLTREYSQRTRSFLFACLAATVARILGLSRIRFYENGIISLNLPPSDQIVGTRATRSTHPKVLEEFGRFFSIVFGEEFTVDNPFIWHTKTDVVKKIADAGCADLIVQTVSCSRSFMRPKLEAHCGSCSQCIDRRIAVLAADLAHYDPPEHYETDVLIGDLSKGPKITLAESYIRTMTEINELDESGFSSKFPQMNLALRSLPGSTSENAQSIYDLYKRQAAHVLKVMDHATKENAPRLLRREIPETSMLAMAIGVASTSSTGFKASDDYACVSWQGEVIEFSPIQAQIIKTLHEHYERGTPSVSQHYLLDQVDSDSSRLRDLFRRSNAWNTLVVESTRRGNFRLNL